MRESKGRIWRRKHNIPNDALDKVYLDSFDVHSMRDVQILLAYGIEFDVVFRGREYFLTPCPDTYQVQGDGFCYETDDLDDFGENARIGENGEFYLKDVIDELEF